MAETQRHIEFAVPSPRQFFTPAVIAILITMVVGFAISNYAVDFTARYLALTAGGIFRGKIWQLATYSFIESGGLALFFDGLVVLFIGSSIERERGTGAFFVLWFIAAAACGLLWVIISRLAGVTLPGAGATSCVYGLIAVFGVIFNRRKFLAFFWMAEARYISIALIVVGIILNIPQPMNWIWISGALVGYIYIKLRLRAGRIFKATPEIQNRRRNFVDID
jgi:membrane associated rhomboid family serine protease